MKRYPYKDIGRRGREQLLFIIRGNPVDGFTLWGPFLDAEKAATWAQTTYGPNGWELMVSNAPKNV